MSNSKSLSSFIEAINIFAKHLTKGLETEYAFNGVHDLIFINVTAEDLPEDSEDGKKLTELGWHIDEEDYWAYWT